MTAVTVGIDIGTTAVKAIAVDDDGHALGTARVSYPLHVPAPDRMEHDAAVAWLRAPQKVLQDLLAMLPGTHVDALAVAAMVPSLCAVDQAGTPIGPGLLYGDARGRPSAGSGIGSPDDAGLAAGFASGAGETALASGAGEAVLASGAGEAGAFLAWAASAAPRAAGFWPAQAVANHALASRAAIDQASAAASYPLYDGTGWAVERLTRAGVQAEQMPAVVGIGDAVGSHGASVVAAGLPDALGEQIVAGAHAPGDVLVICGSTLITWIVEPSWRSVPGLLTIPHSAGGMFLVGGPSNAGGLFLDWVRGLLGGRVDWPPRSPDDIPVWAPYLRGERTPLNDPDRRGALIGLNLTHDAAAILRAAYEAAAFVVRHHLDVAGGQHRRLVVTGGGSTDPAWVQALADCTGLPVDVVAVAEGGALGAAWVARMALGLEDSLEAAGRWARVTRRVEPDGAWVDATDTRYSRFRALPSLDTDTRVM